MEVGGGLLSSLELLDGGHVVRLTLLTFSQHNMTEVCNAKGAERSKNMRSKAAAAHPAGLEVHKLEENAVIVIS